MRLLRRSRGGDVSRVGGVVPSGFIAVELPCTAASAFAHNPDIDLHSLRPS